MSSDATVAAGGIRRAGRRPAPSKLCRGTSRGRIVRRIALVIVALLSAVAYHGSQRHAAEPRAGVGLEWAEVQPSVSSPAEPRTLRLATFNIHRGRGRDGVTDLDRTATTFAVGEGVGFDVVGLNEVAGTLPWRRVDQAELLGRACACGWLFVPTEQRWWHPHFGNGLLSRLPVDAWRSVPLASAA